MSGDSPASPAATEGAPEAPPKPFDWRDHIEKAAGSEKAITAETFLRRRTDTASNPVYLKCDDGKTYVVKPMRKDAAQGRMLFNDQIIARFGTLLGAAVPKVSLVMIPQALIDLNPHQQNGLAIARRRSDTVRSC